MKFRLLSAAVFAGALLAACAPPAPPKAAPESETAAAPAQATGCDAKAASSRMDGDKLLFKAEAIVTGPSCDKAVMLLVARSEDGTPLMSWASNTSYLFGFDQAADSASMTKALEGFIEQAHGGMDKTSTLPDWPDGQESPGGEFPFFVIDGQTRADYLKVRAADVPMFCHVQGMESLACWVLEEQGMYQLGVQLFPG